MSPLFYTIHSPVHHSLSILFSCKLHVLLQSLQYLIIFQKESPRRPLTRPPVVKKIEWPLDWKSSSSADDISDSFSSQPLSLRPYYPHQNDLYNIEPSFRNNEEINLVFTPFFTVAAQTLK